MQRATGSRSAGSTPPRPPRPPSRSRRTDIGAVLTPRPTARSTRRATSVPTRSRCRRPASSSASGRPSPASVTPSRTAAAQRVVGVETTAGPDRDGARPADRRTDVCRQVGRLAGNGIPSRGGPPHRWRARAHAAFDVESVPMVFDIGAGLYWRLEEGGLLFGWSNPDEAPGEARRDQLAVRPARCAGARQAIRSTTPGARQRSSKIWAATIDYTPDHLPIFTAR